ncbi:GCN5 family acetyltransferase [Photobacterium swingsii]|uniref:N-acetyltransferase n=1 Tax=Photobacterium swingsii TaxID=680026 RepID=A0A0J8VDQ1_9GAMM|nr:MULTISPECIES: GNAT family N-acetyltransferase [Photobacterium]KMV31421.1 GCN5 family acetyltransferase [Photobacterium swingsii]MDO6498134.1 GNAT family N-acetyltransferase [Photobacterium sanguinicancri]PSW25069.1 N-acetyltransferase [Photobacterium swingsii]
MHYHQVPSDQVPLSLLLEADPSEISIQGYLSNAWCFVATENTDIRAACIVSPKKSKQRQDMSTLVEIFNVSVQPEYQQQGIGSKLLAFSINALKEKGVKRIELGTGAFGYQLTYYHRLGFRIDKVVKDHFITHYPDPIIENGIQHKDMLRLYLDL